MVVWPEGYSALVDGDEVNVRDEAGVVVARTNATFQIAGVGPSRRALRFDRGLVRKPWTYRVKQS